MYLDLASRGNYGQGSNIDRVYYFAGNGGEGSNLGISYNFKDGSFAEIIHRGTAGPVYAGVMDTCAGLNISEVSSGY